MTTLPIYQKMEEWSAWYSGDPQRIMDAYANLRQGGVAPWYRFWRRAIAERDGGQRALLHVPIASDLAAVSASLLVSEQPRFRIKEAHENEATAPVPDVLLDPTAKPAPPVKKPTTAYEKTEAADA